MPARSGTRAGQPPPRDARLLPRLGAGLALTLAALFILNQKLAAAKTASANVLSDKKLANVQSAAA